ncbi:MAG: hypothetical protein WBC82_07715 [Dehalococcoidia bacterium]
MALSALSFNTHSHFISQYEWEGFEPICPGDGAPYLDASDLAEQLKRKRTFLEALRLEVKATPYEYSFKFTLDGKVVSSADADKLASFNEELEIFEAQHPDITVKDLLDTKKALPEETPFAEKINQFKNNLVTIARTWA